MGSFAEAARERVRQARARLQAALEEQDAYEAELAQDELEDALRLARKHGVDPGEPESTGAPASPPPTGPPGKSGASGASGP
ncbi:hypothetical protein ACIGFK_01355 [Streptomyces sp. NPDC085524]|uniref:hypothetical protein n=1 Tax=Streptomyces sp. NPDC085524 TaxID=3365728 RepID=UPI0037D7AECB